MLGMFTFEQNYSDQKQYKIEQLAKAFPNFNKEQIEFKSFGESGLRSRMDFVLEQDRFGLYSHKSKRIEDLPICLQLSPELQNFYESFRSLPFPELKGSFRLKVSPKNQRGAWLDFSNLDIQALLQNSSLMDSLNQIAIVEMGQKHKIVGRKKNQDWGLLPPQFFEWTESLFKGKIVSLFSTVASFSQPSHISNNWIVTQISQIISQLHPKRILEFGAGFGNLSFPAIHNDSVHLTCLEYDFLSSEALKHNVETLGISHQVTIQQGDFRKKLASENEYDFVLVNPARNGVGFLFDSFENSLKPPSTILYMSCYPETLILDTQKLKQLGYSLTQLKIADQFPQTPHMEVISLWQK
jgi:tRNA/tmRNA/rRNA uracil-C5-methylase (TrmA/RlmC/RlmD family)